MDLKKLFEDYLFNERGLIGKNFELDPFTFVLNFLPATASTTTNQSFLVQADSAFAIVKTTAVVTATDNTTFIPSSGPDGQWPFLITLSDSGSGRDLMDTGVHLFNLFGSAERPMIWSKPKILDPNSTFTGKLQNLSATDRNVRLAFHGFKIFGSVKAFQAMRKV